jgi:hypothetical protein
MTILTKLLTLFIWIGIGVLLLLINRIARFYELTTGVRSYHRLFFVPILLLIAGAARYLMIDTGFAGDVVGDILFFTGGACLAFIGYFLLKLMTGGRS